MQTIRLQLREVKQETVELRYWLPQQKHYESRTLNLAEIADLLKLGKREYYETRLPNLPKMGQQLFYWLDGDGRWLSRAIKNSRGDGLVVAIDTTELAHLPWEVLHDGNDFLVNRVNPVVLPVRWVERETEPFPVEARQLRVLFMATDPENVTPKLDFEREEAQILADTHDMGLDLRVEESGCVTELGKVWSRQIDDFDVFHLTGHASITRESPYTPYFITETETGERQETTAAELAGVFRFRFPKLVFLSACRTGEAAENGAVPSMAEALIAEGARTVLGWGRPVEDGTATTAAAHLYGKLAGGYQLAEALASTYQYLFKLKVRDWHLLRLYVRGECPGAFVETWGDVPLPLVETAYQQFLDPQTQQVRVATAAEFVGRRRYLQRCLKGIRTHLGLLIHGLGGVGKSTLTARLLERMVGYDRLVIYRGLDADKLRKVLAEQCTSEQGLEILNGNLPLMQQLTKFFQSGLNSQEQRFAVVLDDFEANLELRGDGVYVLQPQVVDVLLALLKAVQNCRLPHKVIITSRYDFVLPELNQRLHRENLAALRDADLTKKYSRLNAFNGVLVLDAELQSRAKTVADGNPRLLEWLDKILQDGTLQAQGVEAILQKMQGEKERFRENILAEELLKLQKPSLRKMLGKMLVYELPVPKAAISPICGEISGWEGDLQRAASLGLVEEVTINGGEVLYRVPRILAPLLEFAGEELYPQAAQVLYRLWRKEVESATEAQGLEIHRLALLGKDEGIAGEIASSLANNLLRHSRYREALHLCKSTSEITQDYRVLKEMAYCEQQLGNVAPALEYYQQALKLCPAEDERELASISHYLGILKAEQGEIEQAIALYQQSLEIKQRIGDVEGEAATLYQIAVIYECFGEVEQAIALYNQVLEIDERTGNVKGKAATLHQLAIIYAKLGEVEQAIVFNQQSLEIRQHIGDVQGEANTLHSLARIYVNLGELEQAITLNQQSLEIKQRIGDVQGEAATLHNLADIYAKLGEVEKAIALYHQSLEIFQRIGYLQGQAATLNNIAGIYANNGEVEKAIALNQQSLEIKQRIGDVQGKANALHSLAVIYANKGEVEQAINLFQQSLEIKERIGYAYGKAMTLCCLGQLAEQQGEYAQAISYLQPALEILQKLKSPDAEQVRAMLEKIIRNS
ncbi:tetratricopeptide repeat protein [Anabaena sp. UHCC 0399]|uniref:tetratricopeptide repeat protein n=1 Tax=Anabaena sp. UHCC 0399 TaxID=3110238 RepID=UPI002B21F086|nr:tetratricopeptide repeat protein [Anabaena sp. UHCC 0399]MEA5568305.1 tetratricopeptide repeat protein [Anabaena sp. UHCC 0399]